MLTWHPPPQAAQAVWSSVGQAALDSPPWPQGLQAFCMCPLLLRQSSCPSNHTEALAGCKELSELDTQKKD